MALTAGTSTRTHRLIGLLAALLLATTTALAFGRVFLGGAATLRLLATALVAACLAVVLERRSLLLSTVASGAGLAVAVGLLVFPSTTWYGLPTADTLRAALDAAALVGEQARIQVAPAEPIAPLMLAAVVSLWAAVFSAHALAFRAGSPLLGLIPPVALVAFADTVLEDTVRPLYGVAFLAAALLVVFADGLARVQGWGPVWSSARRSVAVTAGRGARRLALTALAAATVAPIVVPGFGSRAVIDLGTPAEDRVAIDPFVSVRSALSRREPIEVLRVTSPRPTYVRLVSLPVFDGAGWWPDRDVTGVPVSPGEPLPAAEATSDPTETVGFDVRADLDMPWLPSLYPARSIDVPGASIRYEQEGGVAYLDGTLQQGDSYSVEATFVLPTADELRASGSPHTSAADPYLQLPSGFPLQIHDLAVRWTAGKDTVFDKAFAIQEHLRDPSAFRYDENTNSGGGTQTILSFLTVTRAGFCQQFATSMAAMLRSIGIPSRVVVGFTSGVRDQVSGQYSITTDRAHSWVEVRFPGWGWLPFEPTPGRSNPVTNGYTVPTGEPCEGPGCPEEQVTDRVTGQALDPRAAQQGLRDPRARSPRGALGRPTTTGPTEGVSPISARMALLLAGILTAIVLLLVPAARGIRRRLRLRGAAGEPRRLILATYEVFTERAAGLGLARGPGETVEEYRRKVMETGYLSDGHLDRLTRLTTAAAYSDRTPDTAQAREAVDAAETALRDIRRAVGPGRWLVGLYRRR